MKVIGIVLITLVFAGIAVGDETYTISGDVAFQYDGDIYICLFTLEKYAEFQRPGYDLSASKCNYIKLNADLKKAGKISFKFDGIQKGTYGIVSFQDVNKNRKVDLENYCPNEPWGSYKESDPTFSSIDWNAIKFDLEKDITGINIQM